MLKGFCEYLTEINISEVVVVCVNGGNGKGWRGAFVTVTEEWKKGFLQISCKSSIPKHLAGCKHNKKHQISLIEVLCWICV